MDCYKTTVDLGDGWTLHQWIGDSNPPDVERVGWRNSGGTVMFSDDGALEIDGLGDFAGGLTVPANVMQALTAAFTAYKARKGL